MVGSPACRLRRTRLRVVGPRQGYHDRAPGWPGEPPTSPSAPRRKRGHWPPAGLQARTPRTEAKVLSVEAEWLEVRPARHERSALIRHLSTG